MDRFVFLFLLVVVLSCCSTRGQQLAPCKVDGQIGCSPDSSDKWFHHYNDAPFDTEDIDEWIYYYTDGTLLAHDHADPLASECDDCDCDCYTNSNSLFTWQVFENDTAMAEAGICGQMTFFNLSDCVAEADGDNCEDDYSQCEPFLSCDTFGSGKLVVPWATYNVSFSHDCQKMNFEPAVDDDEEDDEDDEDFGQTTYTAGANVLYFCFALLILSVFALLTFE
jgi:hypothetical protein